MHAQLTRRLLATAAVGALALGGAAPAALARHGADDPAGHHVGDDHGRGVVHRHHSARHSELRHGADDAAGHQRHGADDGPNHR